MSSDNTILMQMNKFEDSGSVQDTAHGAPRRKYSQSMGIISAKTTYAQLDNIHGSWA